MSSRGTYRRTTKTGVPTEDDEQTRVCVALDKLGLLYFAVPNGGKRGFLEACKLKRTGVKAGVPDLCIVEPRGAYHGLFLELKRERGGVVSDSQGYWLAALRAKGYRAEVCKGAAHALQVIEDYLNDSKCLL